MQTKEHQHKPQRQPAQQGSDEHFRQSYDIYYALGRGMYGNVYHGIQKSTGLSVAIKSICIQEPGNLTKEELTKRVEHEFVIQTKLHHPNVVTLCDNILYKSPDYYYVVMERCEKDYKQIMLDRGAPFSEPEARVIVQSVAKGLEYLHNHRIIHRDIALKNILVNKKGTIKIADYGLAIMLKEPYTTFSDKPCGTPEYMAPEIMKDHKKQGFGVDVWALGVVIYRLLLNKSPYPDPFHTSHLTTARIDLPRGKLSDQVIDLMSQMLQKKPSSRISIKQVLEHPWIMQTPDSVKRVASLVNASIDSGRGSTIASSVQNRSSSTSRPSGVRSSSCSGRPQNSGMPTNQHPNQMYMQPHTSHQPDYVECARNVAASPHHSIMHAYNSNSMHLSQHLSQIQSPPPVMAHPYSQPYYVHPQQHVALGHLSPPIYSQHNLPQQIPHMMQPPPYQYIQSPELIMPQQIHHPVKPKKEVKKETKKPAEKPPRITLGSTSLANTCLATKTNKFSSLMGKILALQLFDKGPNKESDIVMWIDLDKDEIWTYYVRERGGPKDPVPDKSRAIDSPAPRQFSYATLPEKSYTYYKHLSNYLQTVLSKTPKVTIKREIYKSVLYANGQFIMFIDPKSLTSQSISITKHNSHLVTAIILDGVAHSLPPDDLQVPRHILQKCHNAQQLVALAHQMYNKCLVAERFDEEEWQKDPQMRPFPVIKGHLS